VIVGACVVLYALCLLLIAEDPPSYP